MKQNFVFGFIFLSLLVFVWVVAYNFQNNLHQGQWVDYIDRGNRLVSQKKYQAAFESYSKAADLNANLPPSALAGLGEIYLVSGQTQKARAALEKALQESPNLKKAQTLLNSISLSQKTSQENSSISQKTKIAFEFLKKDQPFLALPVLEKITNQAPTYRDGHYLLGAAYLRVGSYEKAQQEIQEVLRLDPNFEAGKNLLAKINKAVGSK